MIGVLGWLGWKVTVISSNFVSLQLIMTMSLVIHLIVRYRELSANQPQESNRRIILETMRTKLVPSVYAFLTTIVGFASLVFCNILPVIMFGKMMIVGLSISLVVTFLVFPAVLVLLPRTLPLSKRQWRLPITSVTAGFIEASGALVLVIGAAVFVLSAVGMSRLEVENCFIDYFKENTEIHRGMKVIDKYLGGTTPLDVIVDFDGSQSPEKEAEQVAAEDGDEFDEFAEFDEAAKHKKYWFTIEKMDRIKAIHGYLDGLPETGKVMSLATLLSIAEKLNEGKPLDNLELALLYNEIPDELKNLLVKPFVSEEYNQVRFWARVRDSDKSLRRNELLKRIGTELPNRFGLDKQSVHLSGMLVLYNNMLQSLFSSQILTFGMTLLVLMGTYLVEFRSVKIAVIAIIPNALPIAIVLGTMGWLNVPLDMMTITIAAIGLGISDDFTIHYIHRFKDEFQIDCKYVPAMYRSHRSIGYAMFYTSITIILGFSILALSNFIPTVYFGLLTCLAMTIAILDALTILPELLILVKPFGKEA
jgi:predicted RND superfamily exporter protein